MAMDWSLLMLLDLSKLIDVPGSQTKFETSLDLSDLQFGNCCPAKEPVVAAGMVKNVAGVLKLEGTVDAHLTGVCDRCAESFERDVQFPLEAILVTELADEDNEDEWTFLLEGNSADLDDIITTNFVLNMGSRLLCAEDCKGLCCRCGVNLNRETCKCEKETDPRLAVLKQLLKEKDK